VVFEARTAEEAMRLFEDEDGQFDLVFSDVALPGKSGFELLKELQASNPAIKGLLCSGYTNSKSRWSDIQSSGIELLQKPYSLLELLRSVKRNFSL